MEMSGLGSRDNSLVIFRIDVTNNRSHNLKLKTINSRITDIEKSLSYVEQESGHLTHRPSFPFKTHCFTQS